MATAIRLVFEFGGAALVCYGLWCWHPWIGLVSAGLFALVYSNQAQEAIAKAQKKGKQ